MSFFPGQGQQHGYPSQQQYPPQGYGPPPPQGYGPPQGYAQPPPQGYPYAMHNQLVDGHILIFKPGSKVIQAIHPKELLHHSQAMGATARPSHQDRTMEGISRYTGSSFRKVINSADCGTSHHPLLARAMGHLYQEDHSMEGDQVSAALRFYLHLLIECSGLPTAQSNAYNHGNPNAPPPPPQGQHSFGQGAPQGYSFQYSNCTGRRKALLIGINYFGQRGQLRGCINDVKNMSTYLNGNFGYAREDMVILTDDQQNPMSQPTKQNILRAMHWLVKDAKPNDSLFFHYSGQKLLHVHPKVTPADSRRPWRTDA